MRPSRFVFIVLLLLVLLETERLWFLAPDTMAAHFNKAGLPDRFVPKREFFGFQLQTVLIVVGLAILLQVLLVFMPMQLVNLPDREFWFSPIQRPLAMDRFGTLLDGLIGGVLVVLHAGFELAVSANLHEPIVFKAAYMSFFIGGYIVLSGGLLIWLARSFRRLS